MSALLILLRSLPHSASSLLSTVWERATAQLLRDGQTLLSNLTPLLRLPGDKKVGARRQKKVSSALLNLSRSVQELTEENQSLKEDLDRLLSNSPTISKMKGAQPVLNPQGRM